MNDTDRRIECVTVGNDFAIGQVFIGGLIRDYWAVELMP